MTLLQPRAAEHLTNRRQLIAGATGLAGALLVADRSLAQVAAGEQADFLFVQTADSMTFDAASNRLTLRDVGPTTLFFSDRPERIAGNMTTASFVPFWSEGRDLGRAERGKLDRCQNSALRCGLRGGGRHGRARGCALPTSRRHSPGLRSSSRRQADCRNRAAAPV